jgi:hypothetical protein
MTRLSAERAYDPQESLVRIPLDFMLPYPNDSPALAPEFSEVPLVTSPVVLNLPSPEELQLMVPLRESIPVPEIPINENGNLFSGEDHVRAAGQRSDILPEPVTSMTQH